MELQQKSEKPVYVAEPVMNEQLAFEKRYANFDKIRFYEYSSAWWQDYKAIRTSFEKRAVKIYVEDQDK
jgi:hypothetical protein